MLETLGDVGEIIGWLRLFLPRLGLWRDRGGVLVW